MSNRKSVTVSSTQGLQDALAGGYEPRNIEFKSAFTAEDVERVRAQAFQGGRIAAMRELATADGVPAEVKAEIAAMERDRVMAIHSLTQPGLEGIARKAIELGTSLERFALQQAQQIQDRGITLDAIRRDAPQAVAFSSASDDSASRGRGFPDSKGVFAARQAQAKAPAAR